MSQTTFGYVNAWARNEFAATVEEYGLTPELLLSGSVSIPADNLQSLIDYISDPANCGDYGVKLDVAVFYNPDKKVPFGGSIKTPYVKGESKERTPASSRAKRQM